MHVAQINEIQRVVYHVFLCYHNRVRALGPRDPQRFQLEFEPDLFFLEPLRFYGFRRQVYDFINFFWKFGQFLKFSVFEKKKFFFF